MSSSTSPISRNRRGPTCAEEHDRDVVDPGAAVGRFGRDLPADRPQHVAARSRRQRDGRRQRGCAGSARRVRPVRAATPRSRGPGRASRLEDAADLVSLQQQREPGHVVLVRVRQDRPRRSADPTAGSDGRARPAAGRGRDRRRSSNRPPRDPSTRIASPWPTSRIETRGDAGRSGATTPPATATATISAAIATRRARRPVSWAGPAPCAVPEPRGRSAARRPTASGARSSPPPGDRRQSRRATPAAATSNGGVSVRLANGSPAAVWTISTRIRRMTQPGAATIAPRIDGAPATSATPPASARMPAAIAGATSGTTNRLTMGERIARRPKDTRMIGSVAACAASETPRLSASQWGTRPRPIDSIHAVRGVPQAINPAVASDESWKPASPIRFGSVMSRRVAAHPSAAAARPARPLSRASSTTPAISAARTTDGDAPANTTYATIATIVTTERRRRPSRPAIARDGGRDDRDVPARRSPRRG